MAALTTEELLKQQLSDISEQQAKQTKPIELSKAAGIKYNAELKKMVNQVRADIESLLVPKIKLLEHEYVADSAWWDVIGAAIKLLKGKYSSDAFTQWAARTSESFVSSVNYRNQQQFSGFGIDVFGQSATVTEYLQASAFDNARLIKSIPEQYLNQVESLVMANMRAGLRPSAINKQLQNQFGVTQRRAKMIARDQTSKVSNGLAKKRMERAGFEYFKWSDSSDSRVRSRHKEIANKVTAYGKGIYRWDNLPLSDKGDPIAPGDDFQCIPGDLHLNNTSFCNVLYRRWYTGELTELVFSDGVVLRSTANHPILTINGFKPAHLIDSSDDIIRTRNKSVVAIELDSKGMIPTFEQIFSSLDLLGVKGRVSASVHGEFHGDISDSDINVIELNSLLMNVVNPSIRKNLGKFNLSRADEKLIFDSFSCFGNGDFSSIAFRSSLYCLMSRLNLSIPLFFAHFTPLECFGLALGSWFDTKLFEISPDNVSRNRKMLSDCILAFSALVHGNHVIADVVESFLSNGFGRLNSKLFDRTIDDAFGYADLSGCESDGLSTSYKIERAIDNRTVSFSGHVYNLQTISGDYTTGTTIVSNCRCTARPVLKSEVLRNQKSGSVAKGVYR